MQVCFCQIITCYIAAKNKRIIGFACYGATAKNDEKSAPEIHPMRIFVSTFSNFRIL